MLFPLGVVVRTWRNPLGWFYVFFIDLHGVSIRIVFIGWSLTAPQARVLEQGEVVCIVVTSLLFYGDSSLNLRRFCLLNSFLEIYINDFITFDASAICNNLNFVVLIFSYAPVTVWAQILNIWRDVLATFVGWSSFVWCLWLCIFIQAMFDAVSLSSVAWFSTNVK
jgi:hypothetical protein